jgi:formiminoglutamase
MIVKSSRPLISKWTSIREGELKIGEVISCLKENSLSIEALDLELKASSATYALVAIPEDIGVRANYGKKGARHAYEAFLRYFVNIQKNEFIDETKVLVIGEIFVEDLLKESDETEDIKDLRDLTSEVDERVFPVIECIVKSGKTPIVIGGGHNNSYGIIRGVSQGLKAPVQVLNIDPHADFRAEEGRHSGNGFRYAYTQKFLANYAVFGLQENYNNQTILDAFRQNENLHYTAFSPSLDALSLTEFLKQLGPSIGLEIDLDSIKDMPTSAISPIGFSEDQIIEFVTLVAKEKRVLYYHLAEGAPHEHMTYKVGKFLSQLVSDIMKA